LEVARRRHDQPPALAQTAQIGAVGNGRPRSRAGAPISFDLVARLPPAVVNISINKASRRPSKTQTHIRWPAFADLFGEDRAKIGARQRRRQ
jgi:hypothetical protein